LVLAFDLPQSAATLLNDDGSESIVVAEYLMPGRPSALGKHFPVVDDTATGYVVRHGTPLAILDVRTDERHALVYDIMRERGTVSLLIVPLVVRDMVVGTIGLDAIEQRVFSEEEITLAQNVAAAVGQALETARLYQTLQHHADTLEETVAQRTAALTVALEQAQAADRLKSQFVSDVNHELRTPLSSIKIYLSLLEQGRPENKPGYLNVIHRETERLQRLIEELLDLSRLDAGKTMVALNPTDLNRLAANLVLDRGVLVEERGMVLNFEPDPNLAPVLADAQLLFQVLTNLLTNALNYTNEGGTIIIQTKTAVFDNKPWITLSMTDTGPGISAKEQARLFERFYRGKVGRKSGAPGTGLGLAICKEIMERHNGRITVKSALGQGSTFTLWLQPVQE
jgi:signal transduction histidine kinase